MNYKLTISFETMSQLAQWNEEVGQIKSSIAGYNYEHDRSDDENKDETHRNNLAMWLETVMNLITKWGPQKVPRDIRDSFNDVRSHYNLPPFDFGHDDGHLELPRDW